MAKTVDLALGRDRKGKPVAVILPKAAGEPDSVIRLAAGGFLTAEEIVTVAREGIAWRILTEGRPVLQAQAVLKTIWRQNGHE